MANTQNKVELGTPITLDRESADEILVRLSFLNPGWSIRQITEEFMMITGLSVSENTIRSRLESYREKYEELAPERIEQLRLREVQRFDQLEQEAWRAWQTMLEGQVEVTETYVPDKETQELILKEVRQRRTKNKVDIGFLNTIQKIQEARQKLLGLTSQAAQQSAIEAINQNEAMKVYVGVSPDDWDADTNTVIIGEIADGRSGSDSKENEVLEDD